MSTPSGRKPRACINCSRAKAKCVWPSSDDADEVHTCQRCFNNSLECSTLHPGVKRKRGKATQAKVIEQKLDNIMSLLSQRDPPAHTNRPLPTNSFTPTATPASNQLDHQSDPSVPTQGQPRAEAISIVPGFQVSFSEADQALQEYMTDMVPQFPFVPLPGNTTYNLYKEKPLLLKTILWVCRPPGPAPSAAFERWFREHIAHETVVLGNKSLEVLQALLVFFAWSDVDFYARSKDTSLVQLALGLVGDLGLTKLPGIPGPTSGSIVEDAAHLRKDVQARAQHASGDRRTVLGVYYITSILLARPSRLEYMPYFDHCCTELLKDDEYPADTLLVHLIRIRQIALKVNDTFRGESDSTTDRPFRSIHALAIATVQKELETFMDRLPDDLKWNRTHTSTQSRMTTANSYRSLEKPLRRHPRPPLRARNLRLCQRSTQLLFDTFLLIPVETFPSLTCASMFHLALAIVKGSRLLCMEDRDWDLELARASFDLPGRLQQLSDHFEAASRLGRPRCAILLDGRPLFLSYAERFRWMRGSYLSRLGPDLTGPNAAVTAPIFAQAVGQFGGFDLWQQLSDLTYAIP
ncbi:hypothetical protein FOBRF1_007584 [Fusarium oxysporum]